MSQNVRPVGAQSPAASPLPQWIARVLSRVASLRGGISRVKRTAENAWDHLVDDGAQRRFSVNNASALQTMHAYYNRLATGSASQHYLSYFHQKYLAGKQDIEIGSFGSGGGHLERTLVEMGFQAKSIQGYELNPTLVQSANEKAAAMGATHLSYQVADLNAPKLAPRSIDLGIFFHSLHHVTNLEICLGVVAEAIKDDGYLLIVDFVGKNYQQWSDEQIQYATDFLRILPAKYRLSMDGKLVKTKPRRPSIKEVIAGDPSEAVRSEDILVTLEQYFERLEFKSLGGSILNHVFDGIANNFDETKEGDVRLIHLLQGLEEWLESEGYISPDFVFAVYRPLGRTRMAS